MLAIKPTGQSGRMSIKTVGTYRFAALLRTCLFTEIAACRGSTFLGPSARAAAEGDCCDGARAFHLRNQPAPHNYVTLRYVTLTLRGAAISLLCVPEQSATSPPSAEYRDERVCLSVCALPKKCHGWLGSRVVSVLDSGAEGPGFKSQSRRCRVMAAYRRVYDSRHLHLQADC